MNLTRSHEWTGRRLVAYGSGLLDESETLDVEQHLRSCTECRTRLSAIKPPAGSDPGHLPASLVATWPRSNRLLVGIERDLVARHLHTCELCRASLEFAGHAPMLASLRRGALRPLSSGRKRLAWGWAVGLAGALAGAIAWLVAIQPARSGQGIASSVLAVFGLAGSADTVPMTFETAVDSLASGALRLPQPGFRGGLNDPLDVGVVTSVSGLVLVLPPALQPPTPRDGARTITVTLFRDGRELAVHQARFYALGDAIRLRPEGRLDAGEYDLRFSLAPAEPAGRPIVWFYRLRVR